MIKKVFNPKIQDIYILDNKTLVNAYYGYGSIICFKISDGGYVDDWKSGFFESDRLKPIGKLIIPRWDTYEKKWVKI